MGVQLILTHENTDFDGLASQLAAWKLYPQALPVLPRRPNRNLRDFLMNCPTSGTRTCHAGLKWTGSFWWTPRP